MRPEVHRADPRAATGSPKTPTALRGGRDVPVDTLRGVAIILMVAGHVLGGDSNEGMQVADDSSWRLGYLLMADLRIPLFTALSGFVYAVRPLHAPEQLSKFARGKLKRLMFPLLTVASLFAVLQAITPGTNGKPVLSQWWMIYLYGHWHFWFLQSIFILLAGIGIANAFGALTTRRSTAVAITATAVLAASVQIPSPFNVFSINGAIRLAPFFLIGYAVARFWREPRRGRWLLLLLSAALFVARATQILSDASVPGALDKALGISLGLCGIATLIVFRAQLSWKPLARLGYFSFSIYLLHVFGTAPVRIALGQLGITSEWITFSLCLLVGLALPILFECTFGRVGWISWAFLGQRPYRGLPPLAPAQSPATRQRQALG